MRRLQPKVHTSTCMICGTTFQTRRRNDKTCSRECLFQIRRENAYKSNAKRRGTAKQERIVCSYCGKIHMRRDRSHRNRTTAFRFCSRECQNAWNHGRRDLRLALRRMQQTIKYVDRCVHCGKVFQRKPNGLYSVCSNPQCQRAHNAMKQRSTYQCKPGSVRLCLWCGKAFMSRPPAATLRKYCTVKCAQSARRRRDDRLFNDADIFRRDNWMCQLCGRSVWRSKRVPHPLAPTIDHIRPKAMGGTDGLENVQCAHFMCNSQKGARFVGQLRLQEM